MLRRAALWLAAVAATRGKDPAEDCIDKAKCMQQLDSTLEDVRQRITDRVQAELQNLLDVAPTAIMATDVAYSEGLLNLDLSTEENRVAVAQRLYYQIKSLPELYWIYVAHAATGRMIGFRRPARTEIASGVVTNGTLVRTECEGTGQPMQYYKTDPTDSQGADKILPAIGSIPYSLADRDWFKQGMAIPYADDLFSTANYQWTPFYNLADSSIGLSAVRRLETPQPPTAGSAASGVIGADYTLHDLEDFISSLSVPPLADDTPSPVIIIAGPERKLIATNVNASLTGNGTASAGGAGDATHTLVTATDSENALVRNAAKALYDEHMNYASSSSTTWGPLATQAKFVTIPQNSTLRGTALGLEYPVGGARPLRFVTLVVTDKDMDYRLMPSTECTGALTGKLACRDTLQAAGSDLRVRSLQHLTWNVKEYLGTAFVVVNLLDESYNLGLFAGAYCMDDCGKIDIRQPVERASMDLHLKNLMSIYSELYWIYMGQHNGSQYLGYIRETRADPELQKWECSNGKDGGCGTAKFTKASDGSAVATDPIDPLTRQWYVQGWQLGYDEQRWISPYVFGNGKLGISIVKKAFDGGFKTTGGYGVWAADFTFEFISSYIATLKMVTDSVIYIVSRNNDGQLIANNKGAVNGGSASASKNTVIIGTQKEVLEYGEAGQWHATIPLSTMWVDPEDGSVYFVDMLHLTDPAPTVKNSYDWAFVAAVPERAIYGELDFDGAASTQARLLCAVLLAVATLCAAIY